METHGKERMKLAVNPGTIPKIAISILFEHFVQSTSRENVPCVYEAVEDPGVVFQGISVLFRLQLDVY